MELISEEIVREGEKRYLQRTFRERLEVTDEWLSMQEEELAHLEEDVKKKKERLGQLRNG